VVKPLKSVTHGQCDARPLITFPAKVGRHWLPVTGTKLFCWTLCHCTMQSMLDLHLYLFFVSCIFHFCRCSFHFALLGLAFSVLSEGCLRWNIKPLLSH